MKKLFILIYLFPIILISANVQIDKIGVINMEEIINTVFSGKSASVKKIANEREKFEQNLEKLKDNINKIEIALMKERNSDKKLSIEKLLDREKKKYSDYYRTKSYELKRMSEGIEESVFQEVYNVVQRIARVEGYTLIIEKNTNGIFYYSTDIDITQKVIDFFQDNYGEKEEE